jgi:S1-C subfamily serine protease
MLHLIAALQPGKRAAVTVMRNGKALQISVLVGKRPLQIRAQPEE